MLDVNSNLVLCFPSYRVALLSSNYSTFLSHHSVFSSVAHCDCLDIVIVNKTITLEVVYKPLTMCFPRNIFLYRAGLLVIVLLNKLFVILIS